MYKKLTAIIFSLAILAGCTPNESTEVTETSVTSSTETSAAKSETSVSETEAAAAEAEKVAEKSASSIADNIKEALKSEWKADVYFAEIFAEDLNGDGVKELFVNYSPETNAECGTTYVFDVSDGVKKLYKISARLAKGHLYTDKNGGVHYILKTGYSDGTHRYAYFDITYDSVEMPFYADTEEYHDAKVYKNCKVDPERYPAVKFSPSSAEFIGTFDTHDIYMAWFKDESNEISELVQSEIFDGLTYASEAAAVYSESDFKNFEEFIGDALPKLDIAYGNAEAADTSSVDYIKEALQAEWDEYVRYVNLYTADLNGDGVKELFVNYSFGAAMNGFAYVYDVSDGVKKLCEMPARIWAGSSGLYADGNGGTHFILENGYGSTSSSEMDYAIFDIAYDKLKQPLFADVYDWYDGGAHIFEYDLYKNCEIVPDAKVLDGERCFSSDKAEYIGRYDLLDTWDAFEKHDENEIMEIIQKEVYEGLTYISDIEEIYGKSGRTADDSVLWEFEYFWQETAPILEEIYGDTSKEN